MPNPWINLPQQPNYWLNIDSPSLVNFNNNFLGTPYEIIGNILPEPFIGNSNAEIILLNLNPGFAGNNAHNITMGNPNFVNDSLLNLNHDINSFFLLNHQGPGNDWWSRKFNYVIQNYGILKVNKFMCVEWFPYSSSNFHSNYWENHNLPSQQYNFDLVRSFIKKGKVIVIMRSERLWFNSVPQLQNYNNLIILSNPRNPSITPGNMPPHDWATIHNIIV